MYELGSGDKSTATNDSSLEEYGLLSFFGRINYAWKDRYLLEVNLRYDGSSRFAKDNRWGFFPSASLGWNITREQFMMPIADVVSNLKLRASYGLLGNQAGAALYTFAATMDLNDKLGNYIFSDGRHIFTKAPAVVNPNTTWEKVESKNIGLDFGFFGNSLTGSFDVFQRDTKDMLGPTVDFPDFFGADAPKTNNARMRNRGWELAANYFDQKGDWGWQAGFSLSGVKNEITDMKGVEDISNNTINREGEAIGSYYGLKAIGIYRTQADLDRVNANGQKILQNNQEPQLGDIMYEDIDNNGNINDADRTVIGNPFPKMQYSFNLGFSYKDFDVNTFWQGIAGVYRYNWDETTISNGGNKTSRWLDRWSESNPDGSMPRLGGTINDNYSSFWLTKGDYLRLKNLEIGYTFRQREFLTKLGVQSLRLYLAGTNLLTFTSLDDYDPEKLSTDSRNDVHPNTRTYSFGVNVKF